MTRVSDILGYMRSAGTWVNWESTVDRVIVGSEEAEVKTAAVAWVAGMKELKEAVRLGCDLFVTHEPTFYSHRNELDHISEWPGAAEKRKFIEASGLTILRNHDTWDNMPEVGIPWSWAAFLQVEGKPCATRPYMNVYPIPETTLEKLAAKVAARTALIGEPRVQVAGPPDLKMRKLGIGTGCACSPLAYREMGADAGIVCDDGTSYWHAIQWAVDNGFGIVRVNHGTSEEPGVAAMARHLQQKFPDVTFHHIPVGCRFRTVGA
jgi:putative NIF3 family GTP cyclohydrolase 1 type 2